jgi:hypothetical protein
MPRKSKSSKTIEVVTYYVTAVFSAEVKPKFSKNPDFVTKEDGGYFIYKEGPNIFRDNLYDMDVYVVDAVILTDNIRNIEEVFFNSGIAIDLSNYDDDWLDIEFKIEKVDMLG